VSSEPHLRLVAAHACAPWQIAKVRMRVQITKVRTRVQIAKVRMLLQIAKVRTRVQIAKVRMRVLIAKVRTRVQIAKAYMHALWPVCACPCSPCSAGCTRANAGARAHPCRASVL
jgi:hypothetical protein